MNNHDIIEQIRKIFRGASITATKEEATRWPQHLTLMDKPVRQLRYGRWVWENTALDSLRHHHCMCLHCGNFKPGKQDHCKIAKSFYQICREHGVAFIVTRCGDWKDPNGL